MTGLEFCPLSAALLHQVLGGAPDVLSGAYAGGQVAALLAMAAPQTWREVLLLHGRPLAAFGFWPLWPGRAEAWMVSVADAGPRILTAATRRCAERLRALQASDPALHRVEMWVNADAPWRESFARCLGMTQEGHARAWGPDGADHVLYARIADREAA